MSMRINVDGVGEVEVDPSFAQLSPQDQEGVIAEIKQSVSAGRMASDAPAAASIPINAGASSFDLDAAIPDGSGISQAMAPQDAPQTFGFDFEKAEPVLTRFFNDFNRKERRVQGARYGDRPGEKNHIQNDYDAAFNNVIAPALQGVGIDPELALDAARIKQADPKLSTREVLEKVGVRPSEGQGAPERILNPEQTEEINKLQIVAQRATEEANNAEDPQTKRDYQRTAQTAMQQIRQIKGVSDPSPYERYESIRGVLEEINFKKDKGGTVVYDGVRYPISGAAELEKELADEQADVLYALQRDPSSLRVSLEKAAVYKTDKDGNPLVNTNGERILDSAATAKKFDELYATAKPGELVQNLDGSVGPFVGIKESGERGSFVPKRLQPAMKGAKVLAGEVIDEVTPIAKQVGSNIAGVVDAVTYIPRENLKAMPPIALARYGLQYLSEIGRKAEEEEKKKLAGQ